MGMYTEYSARIKLDKASPKLLEWLGKWLEFGFEDMEAFESHPFFETSRWEYLPYTQSAYFTIEHHLDERTKLVTDYMEEADVLILSGSIKDYENEISKFFDWIATYTSDEILGYSRYEETETRKYYINGLRAELRKKDA